MKAAAMSTIKVERIVWTAVSILATAPFVLGCGSDRLGSGMTGGMHDGGFPNDSVVVPAPICTAGATTATAYRLVKTRNLASPLPETTGIAADGNDFWILNGGQNSETNTLVHFDPATGVTDRTFTFTGLIETLGTGAYGITWDGVSVWITVAGNTNKLVTVDPVSGKITRTMSAPTDLGPSDLDFDGSDLWLSTGTGALFQIDRVTGGIKKQFATGPASDGRDNGIAYRSGQLWVGDLFGGMEVQDATTGAVLATATHEDGSALTQDEVGSSCFVGCQLVIASHLGITYYVLQPGP